MTLALLWAAVWPSLAGIATGYCFGRGALRKDNRFIAAGTTLLVVSLAAIIFL